MSPEVDKFDPRDKTYKKLEDLPDGAGKYFKKSGRGFVLNTAEDYLDIARKSAKIESIEYERRADLIDALKRSRFYGDNSDIVKNPEDIVDYGIFIRPGVTLASKKTTLRGRIDENEITLVFQHTDYKSSQINGQPVPEHIAKELFNKYEPAAIIQSEYVQTFLRDGGKSIDDERVLSYGEIQRRYMETLCRKIAASVYKAKIKPQIDVTVNPLLERLPQENSTV